MTDPTLIPAAEIAMQRLARLLNYAYADYPVPVWLDPYQFGQMCEDIDVDLGRSVVAVVDGVPVGLSLLSVRGTEGWISGVGVLPAWRRKGIARRMLRQLLAAGRAADLDRLRLEVLEQNRKAITLYKTLGFATLRDFLIMGVGPAATQGRGPMSGVAFSEPLELLDLFARYHDVEPSWQRDLPAIQRRASRLQGLTFSDGGELVGYLLYQPQLDLCMILDLAVDPGYPRRVYAARQLLVTLQRAYPHLGASVVNVPAQDPLLPAYLDAGYEVAWRQHEMERRESDKH